MKQIFGLLLSLHLLDASARGQNLFNLGDGSWHDAELWSTGLVPNSLQEVRIGTSTPVTVTIEEADADSAFSYIGYAAGETGTVNFGFISARTWTNDMLYVGYEGTGNLNIDAGFVETNDSAFLGYASGSHGSATVQGLGVWWNTGTGMGDTLQVGVGGTGTLNILDGASMGSGSTEIGVLSNSLGEVTLSGTLSSWQIFGSLDVGNSGNGKLTVSNGGWLQYSGNSRLGVVSGSSGEVTVTGANSLWENTNEMYVGDSGEGLLTISAGGKVTSTSGMTYLAHGVGSSAQATVTGTNSIWEVENIVVGRSGTATLLVEAGGQLINDGVGQIGNLTGGNGSVTVTGNSSLWQNSNELWVGEVGTGSLTVSAGGTVTNTGGYIGYSFGGSGEVTVTGNNSWWQTSGELFVGHYGTGKLTIADGGQVTNTQSFMGAYGVNSRGEVIVSGAGSLWANSGDLYLLNTSTLLIEAGGTITNGNGQVGGAFGLSEATVNGAGSQWLNSGDLNLGGYGNGTLRVEAGGFVSSSVGYIGATFGNGTGEATITGSGSQWLIDSDLFVGFQGVGTLTVENGGTLTNANGFVSATSQALVTGAGTVWENEGSLSVGWSSGGTLTVADGGTVKAAVVFMSEFNNWSSSTINLNGTSGSRGVLETAVLSETDQFDGAKLNFNGGILRATADNADFLFLFETGDVEILSGGAFIDTQAHAIGLTNILSGVGGLTKLGTGTLTLSEEQDYSGLTTVSEGRLHLTDTAILSGGVTVEAGAILTGNGLVQGSSTILGNHRPGNSPGISSHEDLTYGSGASVTWELIANTTSGRGSLYDGINVSDALTFNGTTLLELAFNDSGSTVSWLDSFWDIDQQWLVYNVGGMTSGLGNFSVETENWQDAYGGLFNTLRSGSYFDLFQSGSDVWLRFNASAIPEPSRALLLLTGLLGLTLRRRRKAAEQVV